MHKIIIIFGSLFLLTGCAFEDISPAHLFDNFSQKQPKTVAVSTEKSGRTHQKISHVSHQKKQVQAKSRRQKSRKKINKLPKTYLYYLHSASLPELRHYLDSGKAAVDLPLEKYTLLRERRKGMEEDALIQYGSLKELIAAYDKTKNPRFKARILELMKEKETEDSQ